MPTATPELRDAIERRFGDSVDDAGPMKWLHNHGWKLTRKWQWIPPNPDHEITEDEREAIQFLIEEWDMDGIAEQNP